MCRRVFETSKARDFALFSLDADSDDDEVCEVEKYHDQGRCVFAQTVLLDCNPRWAKAFNYGSVYPGQLQQTTDIEFDAFWYICNDTVLSETEDTMDICLSSVEGLEWAQVHPFQINYPLHSSQGRGTIGKARAQAFVEFVCPIVNADFARLCVEEFAQWPIDDSYSYGWGVDYEMPYLGHRLGMKSFICNEVGVHHSPGTTHIHHEKTKVEDNNSMRVLARNDMLDVLEKKHGKDWGKTFEDAAASVGVDPVTFLEWSSYDRGLSKSGARA